LKRVLRAASITLAVVCLLVCVIAARSGELPAAAVVFFIGSASVLRAGES
jgi:hypothetical protein